MENRPVKIIVHHSAYSSDEPQLHKINEWHKKKGYDKSNSGCFIGYHFIIEKDGTVIQTRALNEIGYHCTGENKRSIGICLAGNFNQEIITETQIEALGSKCNDLIKYYKIPITQILPHRRFANTDCFGKLLKDEFAQYCVLNYQLSMVKKILLWIKINLGKLKL